MSVLGLAHVRTASGMGIALTAGFGLWSGYNFLLAGDWNPLAGTLNVFGPDSFYLNFAIVAPAYLTLEAMLTAYAQATSSATGSGRLSSILNVASTFLMCLWLVWLKAKVGEYHIAPVKVPQLNLVLYLSVLDVIISLGVAMLTALALRQFGVEAPAK